MNAKQISDLFYDLGINPNYKGYPYLIHIVGLAVSYDGKPFPNMKDLYQKTAEYYGVSANIVIDNIRTLLRNYWNQKHSTIFSKIFHYPLQIRPTAKEFVAVTSEYLAKHPQDICAKQCF